MHGAAAACTVSPGLCLAAAAEKDFLPFIEDNKQLKYDRSFEEPLDPDFFWMITQRA